jgi:diguanylate cyclase (GGDEF)-like protein
MELNMQDGTPKFQPSNSGEMLLKFYWLPIRIARHSPKQHTSLSQSDIGFFVLILEIQEPIPIPASPILRFKQGKILRRLRIKKQCRIPGFCRIGRRGRRVYGHRMGEHNPEGKKQLNLKAAIRIIQNAGLPDPLLLSDNSDAQVQSIIDALCTLSTHDGLTGLVNAGFFHAVLSRKIDRSLRTGRPCGLMVIDIDHFKQINDTHGHSAGDQVLQSVAEQMKRSLRSMDTAARIGGEEFAVILPECAAEDAVSAATRIHSVLNPLILTLGQTHCG